MTDQAPNPRLHAINEVRQWLTRQMLDEKRTPPKTRKAIQDLLKDYPDEAWVNEKSSELT